MEELDIKNEYKIINKMIKENKIKFSFYNSSFPLELLEFCHNKVDNTIEIKFRDIMTERITELTDILTKIENNKQK